MSEIDILRNIRNKKSGGYTVSNEPEECVATVQKGRQTKYINQTQHSTTKELIIDNMDYKISPYIPINLERFIILLSAESGSGKSLFASMFVKQYINEFPDRKCYYICQTKKEDDQNLSGISNLQQLDTEGIEDITIEDLANSLVVIDDTDFHKDHKKIMKLMNIVVECGRKFGVSLIYCSHIHSKLSESPIYKEVSMYITFPDSVLNNRMIDNNLKISNSKIHEILESNPAFICFNKIYRTLITDSIIEKY